MTSSGGVIGRLIGASVKRTEDPRILTGHGHYVDDVQLPGMLHAAFLRSPYAHARITGIDVSAARAVPGVVAVFTGEDIAAVTNPMMLQGEIPGFKTPMFRPLATDKVRFVGDPVALVVAESRYIAEDARDQILVDYDPLPPIPSMEVALDPSSPPVFDELGDNIIFRNSQTYGDVDGAFAQADRVIHETFRQHRYANVPMETRGGVASYDFASEELTYYAATQSPHALRFFLSALTNQPVHKMQVVARDVGGAFGLKGGVFREDVAITAATKQLGRPVKWIEDRGEHLAASGHAREETLEVEAAVKNDGSILGLKVRMTLDQGAYPVIPFPSALFAGIVRVMLPNAYRIPTYAFDTTIVASNKASYVAYRGPWEVETWVRERLMDVIARELGIDRVELRLKNLISKEEQPTKMVTGPTLERMSAKQTLERALELIDYPGFLEEQRKAREQGRYLGLGFSTFIEAAPGPPDYSQAMGMDLGKERAHARLEPDGHLTVITAQMPHGQSHETTLAQVAAQEMGIPFEHVKIIHGDTRLTPFSLVGTGGSRAATMASGAVLYATRDVKEKVLAIAAMMLEASPEDLEINNAMISVKGVPEKQVPLAQIAMAAYLAPGMLPPGVDTQLEADFEFDGGEGGWSQATHVCWVDVDVETGQVRIPRYLVVEDCGTMINPAIVEGQVRGGVAQGIGGVLLEHAAYDDSGQFLAGSFMDYLLPTMAEIPTIEIDHLETPPISPVNFRGVGEGGAIAAPAAVTNAIEDALTPFGVRVTEQFLPPARILELIGAVK